MPNMGSARWAYQQLLGGHKVRQVGWYYKNTHMVKVHERGEVITINFLATEHDSAQLTLANAGTLYAMFPGTIWEIYEES